MTKLEIFHDARVLALRFDRESERSGDSAATIVSIEVRLHDGRRAEVRCSDVFELDGSGIMSDNQVLELSVRTNVSYSPRDLAWALHVDPDRAERNPHCARLAEQLRIGKMLEVDLVGAVGLSARILCHAVEIRVEGVLLPVRPADR